MSNGARDLIEILENMDPIHGSAEVFMISEAERRGLIGTLSDYLILMDYHRQVGESLAQSARRAHHATANQWAEGIDHG